MVGRGSRPAGCSSRKQCCALRSHCRERSAAAALCRTAHPCPMHEAQLCLAVVSLTQLPATGTFKAINAPVWELVFCSSFPQSSVQAMIKPKLPQITFKHFVFCAIMHYTRQSANTTAANGSDPLAPKVST